MRVCPMILLMVLGMLVIREGINQGIGAWEYGNTERNI